MMYGGLDTSNLGPMLSILGDWPQAKVPHRKAGASRSFSRLALPGLLEECMNKGNMSRKGEIINVVSGSEEGVV